jgi:hypothetical protein
MQIVITFDSFEELEAFKQRIVAEATTGHDVVTAAPKTEEKPKKAPKKAPVEDEATPQEPEQEPEKTETKEEKPAAKSKHTESELKSLITHKLTDGKKKEIKELFAKWGAEKLSDVIAKNPDKIDEIYADAEEV